MAPLAKRTLREGEPFPLKYPHEWLDIRLKSAYLGPDDADPREANQIVRATFSFRILDPSKAPLFWSLQFEGEGVRLHPGLEEPKQTTSGLTFNGKLGFSPANPPFTEFLLSTGDFAIGPPYMLLFIGLVSDLGEELEIIVTEIEQGFIEYTLEQVEAE